MRDPSARTADPRFGWFSFWCLVFVWFGVYCLADLAAISLAISVLVLPSVVTPSSLAARISGSVPGWVAAGVDAVEVVAAAEPSLPAFSNSFLAIPIDRASSGSFCGPQRNIISSTATTTSHSYPINAIQTSHEHDCSRRIKAEGEQTQTWKSENHLKPNNAAGLVEVCPGE